MATRTPAQRTTAGGWRLFCRLVGGSSPNPAGHCSWHWALHRLSDGCRPSSTAYAEPRPIRQCPFWDMGF